MSSSVNIFWIICVITSVIEASKILAVFPVPSISHQKFFRPLIQELARRKHEVVVITTDPAFPKGKCPQNLTEIDVHDISYKTWFDSFKTAKGPKDNKAPEQIKIFLDVMIEVFEAQVNSDEVQKLLKDKDNNFDLLFIDATFRPTLSLAYLYNVPVIEYSPIGGVWGTFEVTGASTHPLLYPLPMRQRVYNLSLREKIFELYDAYALDTMVRKHEQIENKVVQRIFGSKIPDVNELRQYVLMTFLNTYSIWDSNRPVPPNVIYLGWIYEEPHKELAQDVKTFLDSSKNGVIYVNLGVYAPPSTLPAEKLRIFKKVFCQLPYDIILQWDEDELDGRCKNIMISKWFPQSDLLTNPKVKLFINQGDLQSTDEALTAGVPSIVIPLLGDQWFNAEQYVKLNIGIQINMEDITEDKLKISIESIMNEKTYQDNVIMLNKLMRDQPMSSLERAVWWTEHLLRNGGAAHLQATGANMPWTEYYAVDLIILLSITFLILVVGIIFVIRCIIKRLLQEDSKLKVKMK